MDPFFKTNKKGDILSWSPRAEQVLGWEKEEIVGKDISILFPEPKFPENKSKEQIKLTSKTGVEIIFSGDVLKDEWFIYPESQTRTELTNSKTIVSAHEGLIGVDLDLKITSSNLAAEKIYKEPTEGMVGKSIDDVFEKDLIRKIQSSIEKEKEIYHFKYKKDDADILANISPVKDVSDKTVGVAIALLDVSEKETAEKEAEYLKTHSNQTGLINRDEFIRKLSLKTDKSPVVLILNVDHFKLINDSYGHKTGDELISIIADTIKGLARDSKFTSAHFGADEFALFSTENSHEETEKIAEGIIREVKKKSNSIIPVEISLSAGISEKKENQSAEELIISSDAALFEAKEGGRNRIYKNQPNQDASLGLAEKLQTALRENSAILYKQPISNIETGKIERYELLLRLDIDGEIKSPEPFLLAADRLNLSEEVDIFVAEKGIEFASEGETVEINLSGSSLNSKRIIDSISKKLRETHCDPKNVIFEITETSAVSGLEKTRELIYALTDLGCKFMLDDFGTGFGSFSYLKHLPIAGIKIDGDFVRNLTNSYVDQRIIAAIVMISEALEKETVAEWVKDEDTLDLLRDLGVGYAQGYFIGEPEPIDL